MPVSSSMVKRLQRWVGNIFGLHDRHDELTPMPLSALKVVLRRSPIRHLHKSGCLQPKSKSVSAFFWCTISIETARMTVGAFLGAILVFDPTFPVSSGGVQPQLLAEVFMNWITRSSRLEGQGTSLRHACWTIRIGVLTGGIHFAHVFLFCISNLEGF